MPRPLRKPDDIERIELEIIRDINETIVRNIERNKELSADRRARVAGMMSQGWSMYGIALETGITPNTVKRIVESGLKFEPPQDDS